VSNMHSIERTDEIYHRSPTENSQARRLV